MRRAKVRLFVEADLAAGEEAAPGGDRAHYLVRVMRLAAGDRLCLFNGRDGEWLARVLAVGKGACRLHVETRLRSQRSEPGPSLLFAPLKKDALDLVVEKATELGAEHLLPVATRFTAVERMNLPRLRAQAIEAAEQCSRLTVPEVAPLQPLAAALAAWPAERPLLFMDERGGGVPIADALAALRHAGPARPAPGILVGPEGGFAGDEAAMIAARPFVVRVDLGPRILRAETAAIAALACWQAFAGDWRPANDGEMRECPDRVSRPTSPRPTGGG